MTDRRRLWRAENQDISISRHLFEHTYSVKGTRGKKYTVDLEKPSCECPDWQKRAPTGGCKHILKIKLKNGDVDPLRSEKTNSNRPISRSQSDYPEGWQSLSEKIKKRDQWECQRCGSEGGPEGNSTLHAHHILPKSKGGGDHVENLISVCHECHEQIHGHPIPSPEPGDSDAQRSDRGSTIQELDSSAQTASTKTNTEANLPENTQNVLEEHNTYPHSKYNHEAPQVEPAIQDNRPYEPQSKQDEQIKKNDVGDNGSQEKTSPHQNSSQEQSQNSELENKEGIGIVGTVWACIGLTLVFTATLSPIFTFTPWKLGIPAALCSLLFMLQLITKSSDEFVRDLTGTIIFMYVSVTAIWVAIV